MAPDKIDVRGDSRIQFKSAQLNGRSYGYILGRPKDRQPRATIFLIHGFPDLSMGWRYQIPMLIEKGFQVVAIDCLGYGRTDAPEDHKDYSHKRSADDIKELATQLGVSKIAICGHDWGAALAYRVALWHPELITHVITLCVPYAPPTNRKSALEDMVRTKYPHFGYQLQFMSGRLEKEIVTKEQIRQFLICLYGGRTEDGQVGVDPSSGILVDKIGRLKPSSLLSEAELNYYVYEFARHGIHGPLNWYRLRDINYEDELRILDRKITVPHLFIPALNDVFVPPHLGKSMSRYFQNLTVEQVNASHWALWEQPEGVNKILSTWLDQQISGSTGSKL